MKNEIQDDAKNNENDIDDDGWGSSSATTTSNVGFDNSNHLNIVKRENMMKEIRTLQQQQSSNVNRSDQEVSNQNINDLFIPIMTMVSISGFVGAYLYETIRLYKNGELYLPFQ